jgi:hypothetical protein
LFPVPIVKISKDYCVICYRFLRAVSYRWLARWLFGIMGWENTRPLSACIYHHIRTTFPTGDAKGYVSGEERAEKDS